MKIWFFPTPRQVYAATLIKHRSTVLVKDYGRLRAYACDREERVSKVHNWVFLALHPYYLGLVVWVRLRVWWAVNGR